LAGKLEFCARALLAALGIGLAATAIALAQNSNLPAKVRQWLSDHASEFDEQSKKQERREPTPVTVPSLFEYSTIEGKKVAVKKNVGEIWEADLLHGNHFEVYSSERHFAQGKRTKAVTLDGRLLHSF